MAIIMAAAALVASCGGNNNKKAAIVAQGETQIIEKDGYNVVLAPEVDIKAYPQDEEGRYIIFDGTSLDGWRGYAKDHVPSKWVIEDGCLKFEGSGGGEAQMGDGGDIIFCNRLQNFELSFDWKVTKGANSGVFILAQEVTTVNEAGETRYEPIFISSPEYQILDNANHPDSFLGENGNRKSASLYDMIPADPQNQNPYGEWNTAKILVYQGTVAHFQNDVKVLEYHLWTQAWDDLLQASKFSQEKWPLAYTLLSNCGGDDHKGYIGFQDHGDVVYYRNIKVKLYE